MAEARETRGSANLWKVAGALICLVVVIALYSEHDTVVTKAPSTIVVIRDSAQSELEKAVPTIPALRKNAARAPGSIDIGTEPALGQLRLGQLFDGSCVFGIQTHCELWQSLSESCDGGSVEECAQLGELLISAAPMQPLWASLFFRKACELGMKEVCEKGRIWHIWSQYGYGSVAIDKLPPEGLVESCDDGDIAACGIIALRGSRDGVVDEELAIRACEAGFRDVCITVAGLAPTPEELLSLMRAGCEIPDALICSQLADLLGGNCDPEEYACPTPNPVEAIRYEELACKLDSNQCM